MFIKRALLTTLLAVLVTLTAATVVGAQENPDYTAPAPTVDVTAPPTGNSPQTLTRTPTARSSSAAPLALTGSDVVQLLVVGGIMIGGGAGVLLARRRAAA
jgi:LPXTG-motif cell wall-anchored protein